MWVELATHIGKSGRPVNLARGGGRELAGRESALGRWSQTRAQGRDHRSIPQPDIPNYRPAVFSNSGRNAASGHV